MCRVGVNANQIKALDMEIEYKIEAVSPATNARIRKHIVGELQFPRMQVDKEEFILWQS